MVITKIRVGKTRSIKVADYQYFKPMVEIEAEISAEDDVTVVSHHLSSLVDIELDEVVKTEGVRFRTVIEIRDLKRVMDENHETSAEYKLAKARHDEITSLPAA